jgi:hypothetical protein
MSLTSDAAGGPLHGHKLKILTLENIQQLDEICASVNTTGEVRLVVQHGELRFINKVESHSAQTEADAEEG